MKEFIKDIFTEDKDDNKYSSKKTMGLASGVLCCIAFLLDMFTFISVNIDMFESLLIFSATMLGVSVVRGFSKTKQSITDESNKDNQ
jgi:hypothetical protein